MSYKIIGGPLAPLVLAANTVEQRNGTTAQVTRIYNTYTDANTYERLALSWVSNIARIEVEQSGGSDREMVVKSRSTMTLETANSGTIALKPNGTVTWNVPAGGVLQPNANNSYDLGDSTHLLRSAYIGTSVIHSMGTGAGTASMMGVANVNVTAVGNVGAGEDDLITYALPANSLSANGKGLFIKAWGTTANNANAKTVKLYLGSAALMSFALVASIAGTWIIEALVFRSGSNTQEAVADLVSVGVAGAAVTAVTVSSPTQTDTGALTVKCTGTATSDNDVTQKGLLTAYLA